MDLSLESLCSYYLDCLSKEVEEGIWRYASNSYGPLEYVQLFNFPCQSNDNNVTFTGNCVDIINRVRANPNSLILQLGYPINLSKPVGKNYLAVEPILLFQFESDSFIPNGNPVLLNEPPTFNFGAIKSLSGLPDDQLLSEILDLHDALGLNELNDVEESLNFILSRLQEIRPHWNWQLYDSEEPLTKRLLHSERQTGIHNAAALFATEKSKYTKGLETEINELKKLTLNGIKESALHAWITNNFSDTEIKDYDYFGFPPPTKNLQDIIEPLSLNEEQKDAVINALNIPLTVIKGPPGTGKSQVVTSIIVNAIYQEQTVLFTSRNNKAVDVVYERVEGLSSSPAMLRLGGTNQLQSKLIDTLSNIQTAIVSERDYKDLAYYKELHSSLKKEQSRIELQQRQLTNLVNSLNYLESSLKPFRETIGEDTFLEIKKWPASRFTEIEDLISRFEIAIGKADGDKQNLIVQLLWFFLKKPRFKVLVSVYEQLIPVSHYLGANPTAEQIAPDILIAYSNFAGTLRQNLKHAKNIQEYFRVLSNIKSHKSLFELAKELGPLRDEITDVSNNVWSSWLKLLPDRIKEHRNDLGEYLALLNLIAGANAQGNKPPRYIWRKFYALQEKMTNILSCWSVTSLSANRRLPFKSGFFDLVIIDEASQCDIASALPLLYRAKRAVIIGDEKQLSHITAISKKQDVILLERHDLQNFTKWGYRANSLFGLALSFSSAKNITLNEHHRSHADIIGFSNRQFYGGTIRIATKYSRLRSLPNEPAVRWIDVRGEVISPDSGGSLNQPEAIEAYKEVKRLVINGYRGTIGVVTPFRAQKNRINDLIKNDRALIGIQKTHDFLCDTAHGFQGDERDVIIFSPVLSSGLNNGSTSFLARGGNLFNVAITRARAALIIVGNQQYCNNSSITYIRNFASYVASLESSPPKTDTLMKDLGPKFPKLSTSAFISNWEKRLYQGLHEKGIKTIPQLRIDQYQLDFALFVGDKKLNIEVDGERYHRNWDGDLIVRDQIRNKRLIELGWDVLRFWVYEVRDDFDGCIIRVQKWMGESEV